MIRLSLHCSRSPVVRGGAARALALGARKVATFGTVILVARYLSATEAGRLFLGLALAQLFGPVVSLGMPEAVMRLLSNRDYEARRDEFRNAALGISLTAALATLLGGVVCAILVPDSRTSQVVAASGVLAALFGLQATASGVFRTRQRAARAELSQWLGAIGAFVVTLTAIKLGLRSGVGLLWLRAGVEVPATALILCLASLPLRLAVGRHPARALITVALPLWITGTAWLILQNCAVVLLTFIDGDAAGGKYTPLARIADLIAVPSLVLGPYIFTHAARITGRDSNAMATLYRRASHVCFVVSLPLVGLLLALPGPILGMLYGSKATGLASSARILATGYLLNAMLGFNGVVLEAIARPRQLAKRSAAFAIVIVALDCVLVPVGGILGAAVGTAVGFVGMNVVNSWLLYRTTGISPFAVSGALPWLLAAIIGAAAWGAATSGGLAGVGLAIGAVVAATLGSVLGAGVAERKDRVVSAHVGAVETGWAGR